MFRHVLLAAMLLGAVAPAPARAAAPAPASPASPAPAASAAPDASGATVVLLDDDFTFTSRLFGPEVFARAEADFASAVGRTTPPGEAEPAFRRSYVLADGLLRLSRVGGTVRRELYFIPAVAPTQALMQAAPFFVAGRFPPLGALARPTRKSAAELVYELRGARNYDLTISLDARGRAGKVAFEHGP